MRLSHKQEDWELDDPQCFEALSGQLNESRDLLIGALGTEEEAAAARLAEQSLAISVRVAEELSTQHAGTALAKRRQLRRKLWQTSVGLQGRSSAPSESYRRQLVEAFDFVAFPICWRQLEPHEQQFDWRPWIYGSNGCPRAAFP